MRIYRVVEVSAGSFRGQVWVPYRWIDRLMAFARARPVGPGVWLNCTPAAESAEAIPAFVAGYEADMQKGEYLRRNFPKEISVGHVANNGVYYQLRRD